MEGTMRAGWGDVMTAWTRAALGGVSHDSCQSSGICNCDRAPFLHFHSGCFLSACYHVGRESQVHGFQLPSIQNRMHCTCFKRKHLG
jgi:hypothetical protein